jgi:hypothetical protein
LIDQRHAERVARVDEVRIRLDFAPQDPFGVPKVAQREIAISEPVTGAASRRLLQRFAQRRNRFLEAVLEQEARAEEAQRLGVARILAQRLPRKLLRGGKIVALDGAPAVCQVCYGMGTADRSWAPTSMRRAESCAGRRR